MVFFGKKTLKKVAKKIDGEFNKIGRLRREGKFDKAINKLLEMLREITQFPEEEFRRLPDAGETLFNIYCHLTMAAYDAERFEDCIRWGFEALKVAEKVLVWKGLASEEEAAKMLRGVPAVWYVAYRLVPSQAITGMYEGALEVVRRFVGEARTCTVPEGLIRAMGEDAVRRAIIRLRFMRLMTVLAWEGMLRGDTAFLLKISIFPAKESVAAALEALNVEALREAYARHGIPLEALEGDLEALEVLAKVYELR